MKDQKALYVDVWSANTIYLVLGAFAAVTAVACEILAAQEFVLREDLKEAFWAAAAWQIPAIIALLVTGLLDLYKRRKMFSIYFSKIEDLKDLRTIKKHFHVCQMDEYGILFVEKKDAKLYKDRSLFYSYSSTEEAEKKLFSVKKGLFSFIK